MNIPPQHNIPQDALFYFFQSLDTAYGLLIPALALGAAVLLHARRRCLAGRLAS